jgi:hypothetical protein
MQRAYPLIAGVLALAQSGCGGSQAQGALTQAAVFAAIEVAGAALQAAADEAASRDAQKRAQANHGHPTPTANWRLVREADSEADSQCEMGDAQCNSNSECEGSDTCKATGGNSNPLEATKAAVSVGGCMVCE